MNSTRQEDRAVPTLRTPALEGELLATGEPSALALESLRVEGYTVEIDALFPSPTNPRTRFPEDSLLELASNIRQCGVMQPIVARPIPADFAEKYGTAAQLEIVAGERRWRASRLAGLQSVPVILRHLSDEDLIALQITENLQREGLSAIEEAEGFDRLIQRGMRPAELAQRLGKSKGFVYQRLKLLALAEPARQALYAGDIDATVAVLLARMPSKKDQLSALERVRRNPHDGRTMSFREAADHIRRNFATPLAQAAFPLDDAKLVKKAGACTACPKRSGAQPEIYPDGDPDLCTDGSCFGEKRDKWLALTVKEAKAAGRTVIEGEEAKKLMQWSGSNDVSGHAQMDEKVYHIGNRCLPNDLYGKTPAEIFKTAGIEVTPTLIPSRQGRLMEIVSHSALRAAVKKIDGPSATRSADREAELRAKRETQFRRELVAACREALERQIDAAGAGAQLGFGLPEMRAIARQFWARSGWDMRPAIFSNWCETDEKLGDMERAQRVTDRIPTMNERELVLFMWDLSFVGMVQCSTHSRLELPEPLAEEARHRGLDPKQARKAFDAREAEPKGKKGKKAAGAAQTDEPARCPNTGELPLTAAERAARDPSAPKVGDRVRATDKALPGSRGKVGVVEALHAGEYTVRFGPDDVAPLMFADEIELEPSAETAQ